jgi:branched-chain amino acid transport system substrate-binding protein
MLAGNTETLDKALQVVQVNQKRLTLLGGKAVQVVQVNQKRLTLLGGDDVYTLKTLEIGREKAVGMVVAVP